MEQVLERCTICGGSAAEAGVSRPALPDVTSSAASTSVSGAIRNDASPISSASTPPGPNATSGPKTGSWTTPARARRLLHHRLDDHRRPDALGSGANARPRRRDRGRFRRARSCGRPARRSSRPPGSRARPRPRRPRRRRGERFGTSGSPYARSSSRTSSGPSQASSAAWSARSTTARARASSMPSSSAPSPAAGAATPPARPPRPSARRRLRVGERGDAAAAGAHASGTPSAEITTASTGFSPAAPPPPASAPSPRRRPSRSRRARRGR